MRFLKIILRFGTERKIIGRKKRRNFSFNQGNDRLKFLLLPNRENLKHYFYTLVKRKRKVATYIKNKQKILIICSKSSIDENERKIWKGNSIII
jgi:hypothetical protein